MTRISAVPAGTRRRVYLPSGPVVVTRDEPSTITRASWSGVPAPCSVTVPVTVPPCAAATVETTVRRAVATALVTRLLGLKNLIVLASLNGGTRGGNPG